MSAANSFSLRSFGTLIFIGVFCLFNDTVKAQDTVTGAFQGTVFSSTSGTYIPNAAVEIASESTGVVHRLNTDSNGIFYQGLLAPGWYLIKVAVAGYKARVLRREIKVSFTGEVVPVPVALDPEPSGAPPSTPTAEEADDIRVEMNTSDARRDASFKAEELGALPLGGGTGTAAATPTRSFDELALLAPGVAPPPQTIGDVAGPGVGPGVGTAGQFAVNGLRSRGNNFTVDGSDNNDEDVGVRRQGFVALVPQPVESVQEFQIVTLLAPAQFGRNIGAQVNAVSKGGGNAPHGGLYGFFNSDRLNARDFFDAAGGNAAALPLTTAAGKAVTLDGNPITVTDDSGSEDPFTFYQFGGTLGGPIQKDRTFYFLSGEHAKINASREKSFAVPTVEERGPFGTGASGTSTNFFTGAALPTPLFPTNSRSDAIFSLFPFPNNPSGVYGANTFTRALPASGEGVILSGRSDHNFAIAGRTQSFTARYNFTNDNKDIPAVNEALFSSVRSRIQTHNLSLFLNSQIGSPTSEKTFSNQVRFSIGRTRLNFKELRDTALLIPSDVLPDVSFLLNRPAIFNKSLPSGGGAAMYSTRQSTTSAPESTEHVNGPLGEVVIAGYSPLGTDVFNFPQTRVNLTYQLADEITFRTRSHTFVFGADTRRTTLDSDLPRLARTMITFNGAPRLVQSGGNPCPNGSFSSGFCFLPVADPMAVLLPRDIAALGAASNSLLTLNIDGTGSPANLRYYQLNFYGQDTWRVSPNLSFSLGLRYEYNTPVEEVDGRIENSFSDPRLDDLPALQRLVNGRTKLYGSDLDNFGPRLGFAYSRELFGKNRVSVFRGGYGLFYDQILGAVANQSRNVFPTFMTVNFGGIKTQQTAQLLLIFNPANSTAGGQIPVVQPGTQNTFNSPGFSAINVGLAEFLAAAGFPFPVAVDETLPAEELEMPMAHHYSFTFEQQLNANFALSVAYVGTAGRHLLRFTTPNQGPARTAVPTDIRSQVTGSNVPVARGFGFVPNRPLNRVDANGNPEALGAVNQFETTASSNYNSFQAELRGRFRQRFRVNLSYTFSKVTDDVSDVFDLAGAYVLPQDSLDLAAERGPANFDVRHRWAYDLIYSFRKSEGHGFVDLLTNGLEFSSTGRFHSGQPFTVNSLIDVNLDGNLTDRLNSTDGIEVTGDRGQPLRVTTANKVSLLATFGSDGAVGRNSFRAGSVLELDLSVIKHFSFGTRRLSMRADIFNFINRANFGIPVRLLEAPGFGRAVSTVTPGRRIQFSVKYDF